jgi:hypothetical protein
MEFFFLVMSAAAFIAVLFIIIHDFVFKYASQDSLIRRCGNIEVQFNKNLYQLESAFSEKLDHFRKRVNFAEEKVTFLLEENLQNLEALKKLNKDLVSRRNNGRTKKRVRKKR